jgi:hypothetical protein
MRRRLPILVLVVAFLLAVSGSASAQVGKGGRPEGLVTKKQSASAGYRLYSPLEMEQTYLVDLDRKVAHTWRHDTQPGLNQYLLEDGTLVRAGRLKLKGPFKKAKGQGGRLEALDWGGNLLWRFDTPVMRSCSTTTSSPFPTATCSSSPGNASAPPRRSPPGSEAAA